MPTELFEAVKYCCKPMSTLRNPETMCYIGLNEENKLSSCDDPGDELPSFRLCPWCGAEIKEEADAPID